MGPLVRNLGNYGRCIIINGNLNPITQTKSRTFRNDSLSIRENLESILEITLARRIIRMDLSQDNQETQSKNSDCGICYGVLREEQDGKVEDVKECNQCHQIYHFDCLVIY